MKTKLGISNLSDIGKVRKANEDYFGAYTCANGNLIIVCDGMGGYKGGAIASHIAVDTIKAHFDNLTGKFFEVDELKNALIKADLAIKNKAKEDKELSEMGSTVVVLFIKEGQAFTAHIGDSRIYMIRGKKIHMLTKDHSLVQQLVEAGIITAEAAKEHPQKNIITRSLGADDSGEPEVAQPFQTFKNDKYILCSDGLTGYLEDDEILQIVNVNPIQDACRILIDTANERGGKDNITVQIVEVKNGKTLPENRLLKKM